METIKGIPKNVVIGGALILVVLIIIGVAVFWKAPVQAQPPVCNNNGVCDPGETKPGCPQDCVPTGAQSAARDENSTIVDISPTVNIRMSSPNGVKSCGTGTTDSSKWECVVKDPGAMETDVSCTLKNYYYDGSYMLALRCTDNNGNDIPVQIIDNTFVCANMTSGCGRWLPSQQGQ